MYRSLILMIALTNAVFGCGRNQRRWSTSLTESIYQKVEFSLVESDHLKESESAIGSLQTVLVNDGARFAYPFCTGIRISPAHVLTANHCVKASTIFNPNYFAKTPLDGTLKIVTFEHLVRLVFDGSMSDKSTKFEQTAPLMSDPLFRDELLDFAILPIDPQFYKFENIKNEVQSGAISKSYVDLAKLKDLFSQADLPVIDNQGNTSLLGYPNGTPLVKSLCHQVFKGDEAWIYHDCDALNGASGGLISVGAWPMAMHLAGPANNDGFYYKEHQEFESPEEFAQRHHCPPEGQISALQCRNKFGFNRALPLTTVAAILQEKAPLLWQQILSQGESHPSP